MTKFYTTATVADYENDNAMHMAMDRQLREVQYYMVGMVTVDNMEEWKSSHGEYEFVKIAPDQEELTLGTVYVYDIKYFGDS
tara:strand:- start:3787 stop:4032 length:246 start_codon:yes stop_codon:yes gene_type:complete